VSGAGPPAGASPEGPAPPVFCTLGGVTDELEARGRADDTGASTAVVAGLDPDLEQVGAAGLDHHLPVQGGEEGQVVERARHAVQPGVGPHRFVEAVRPSVEFGR
jgi:hypothetical protein